MKARNVKMYCDFFLKGRMLARVPFERNPEVLYRCTMNIAAFDDHRKQVVFIPLNEEVDAVVW